MLDEQASQLLRLLSYSDRQTVREDPRRAFQIIKSVFDSCVSRHRWRRRIATTPDADLLRAMRSISTQHWPDLALAASWTT